MKIGCFSISLSVKDLHQSKRFYEKLGFEQFAGEEDHGYLIMKNGSTNIGLFQGMFEGNMMTFNPGWDQDAKNISPFSDIRELHQHLKSQGIEVSQAIETKSGPASFTVADPDGNPILIDQHV